VESDAQTNTVGTKRDSTIKTTAMTLLRIGTVPYCNAFPLIHYLPEYLPGAEISEWYPSAMREQLAAHNLDLVLMPVAELLSYPQGKIIGNCSIACNGAVRSVLLFSRKPIEQIESISLDAASRSSVMICEVILRHFYALQPEKHRLETYQNPNDCPTDAFVVIGDRALAFQPSARWSYRYDVGELWKEKTGLPLVFAAWIGNSADASVAVALEAALERGLQQLELILEVRERRGVALPLDRAQILDYYRRAVVYTMGKEERTGLQRFFDLAVH
jgi:chorismate dehydratase